MKLFLLELWLIIAHVGRDPWFLDENKRRVKRILAIQRLRRKRRA